MKKPGVKEATESCNRNSTPETVRELTNQPLACSPAVRSSGYLGFGLETPKFDL